MRKYSLVAILLTLLLAIPISVYASNITDSSTDVKTYNEDIHAKHHRSSYTDDDLLMQDMLTDGHMTSELMYGMMNEDFDCIDSDAHDQYIEEQKSLINQLLLEGVITQEDAIQQIADLEQLIQYHEQYHQEHMESNNGIGNCH